MNQFKLAALALLLGLAACGGTDDAGTTAASPNSSSTSSSSTAVVLPGCATPTNTLYDITAVQGAGATSPLVDKQVAVRGVVTGDFQSDSQLKGFFIQQVIADNDPLTSEGIFIYAPSATDVKAGDYVQVEGTVAEYKSSTDTDTLTEITTPTAITVCGSGVSVATQTVTLPLANKAQFEALEGMLVEFKQNLTVTETYALGRYGQLTLSSGGRLYHANNHPSLAASAATAANALNQIVLDDGSSTQNPNPLPYLSATDTSGTRRTGDMVSGIKGVLTFSANAYRIHPVVTPNFTASNPRGTAPKVGGTLKAGSLNVLNYFTTLGSRGATDATELTRQKAKLVEAIAGLDADVLGLMEIENGSTAIADLVAAINAKLGSGTYAAIDNGAPGTDDIKVAILYKPARVATVGTAIVPSDSGFVVNGGLRPPVAQRFAAASNGGNFWFVVNHLKSKGSCPSSSTDADQDYGQGCWNASRVKQASTLSSWVAGLVSASGEKDVLMVGDFNSYLKEDPITTIEAAGFEDLHYRLAATDRYTYVYSGESGVLDHAFASGSLKSQVTGFGVWHINADEPTVLDYNTEYKTDDRYAATAYRSSDHDPVLIGLNLNADVAATVPMLSATLPTSTTVGTAASITGIAAANGTSFSVDWGDGSVDTLATTITSANHSYKATGTFSIRLVLKDANGQIAEKNGRITVAAAVSTSTQTELFFSEYIEGSSNNKALEIYNPTSSTVDLSAYTVKLYANGGTTASNTQALSGTLAAGQTLVILNAAFTTGLSVTNSITSTVTYFNGDDAVTLEKGGVVIDQIGVVGEDPGTAWTTGTTYSTLDKTLRRKSSIVRGSVPTTGWDISAEWEVFDKDTFGGLGAR